MCCAWVAAGGQTCSVDMKNCTHHNSPFDVSEHARVDGPWFDYWLAVGGETKTWDAMDDHQRARGAGVASRWTVGPESLVDGRSGRNGRRQSRRRGNRGGGTIAAAGRSRRRGNRGGGAVAATEQSRRRGGRDDGAIAAEGRSRRQGGREEGRSGQRSGRGDGTIAAAGRSRRRGGRGDAARTMGPGHDSCLAHSFAQVAPRRDDRAPRGRSASKGRAVSQT